MVAADRRAALDHVVVVMFENRSFDNLLGRLYQPGEVEAFEGVARQGAEQPDPWLGRARRGPQGRALWHLAHHEHPLARSG
jgi:phospholipase C